jgi:hypothetical protein
MSVPSTAPGVAKPAAGGCALMGMVMTHATTCMKVRLQLVEEAVMYIVYVFRLIYILWPQP